MSRAVGVFLAIVALLAIAGPSQAAFPGKNGKIAFASNRDGDYEIYVMNPDGSGQTPLTSNTVDDQSPAWSPDGRRIAFTRSGDLWAMNADGTGQTLVFSPFGMVGDPAWSPDGTRLVFAFNTGISVVNANGTGYSELTNNGGHSEAQYIDSEPAWSPDGTTILFSTVDDWYIEAKIWAIAPDGTALRQVLPDVTGGESRTYDRGPNWAPAGPRFAYSRSIDPPDEVEFPGLQITTEADPWDYTVLTGDSDDRDPAWSPDGTMVAFVDRWEFRIFVMPASGGPQVALTHDPNADMDPDWQPIPVNSYARPRSANWMNLSMVLAFEPCTAPNRTHGPPFESGSCSPPQQTSNQLTVGAPDANGAPVKATGQISYLVLTGNPNTSTDEADVQLRATIKDVRNAGSLSDYAGGFSVKAGLRVTDKNNTPHPGGPGAATASDGSFAFNVPCVVTGDTSVGSTCSVLTSADAVAAGKVKERVRSVWQLGPVDVYDGSDTRFLTQGVFVP